MSERSPLQQQIYNQRLKFYDTHEKPKAGTWYVVPKGAWLDSISIATYGRDRTADIIAANPYLKQRSVHVGSQLPYIHPNDRLWLPPDIQPLLDTIPASDPDEIAIRIKGLVYHGFEATSIQRSLETCADAFTFSAPYNWEEPEHRILDPKTYYKTDLFIGGGLYIPGEMMKWTPDRQGGKMTIECRTTPGVIVDCVSLDKSLNYQGMTLKQIADSVLLPFGIMTVFPDGDTDPFVKANRDISAKVFEFLAGLAKQKGFVITSTIDGKLSFTRAALNSAPVAALIEGQFPVIDVNASYDGTKRYSQIIAISQSAGQQGNRAEVEDKSIPAYRPIIFTADETEAGNIQDAAKWQRSRALADSMPVSVSVIGWRDPQGAMWKENTIVTLYAPGSCIFMESKFLITSVALKHDTSGGKVAELGLALPQAFTLEFPEVLPWQR